MLLKNHRESLVAKLSHSIVSLYFQDEQPDVDDNLPNRDRGDGSECLMSDDNKDAISFYDGDDEKNAQHFHRELFMLSIFNGHYISWIRDPNYHHDYVERVAILLNRFQDIYPVHLQDQQLSRWLDDCVENRMLLSRWLLFHSIVNCFRLERELQLTIDFHCDVGSLKRLLIYADYDCPDPMMMNRVEHLGNYLCQLDFGLENSTCQLRIPALANHSDREMFINLVLQDNDRQLFTMRISETLISGYSGWSQRFTFEEHIDQHNHPLIIEFTMSANWSLWPESIDEKFLDNSLVLSIGDFLSSAFLLINGQYVWKFFRPFFLHRFVGSLQRECDVHGIARRTVSTLLLVIDEPEDQVLLFNNVYRPLFVGGANFSISTLDLVSFVAVFAKFAHHDDQLEYLKLFEEFILANAVRMVVDDEHRIVNRLLSLLSHHSGQYETQQLEEM
ncbi:hypothetical protein BLA29_001241, partial [Euroglyphus maynei]